MSLCGGSQPRAASLTLLLQDEAVEATKSLHSPTSAALVPVSAAQDEVPHQTSQDWKMCPSAGGRAGLGFCSRGADLGEGGSAWGSKAEGRQWRPKPSAQESCPGWVAAEPKLCRALQGLAPRAAG